MNKKSFFSIFVVIFAYSMFRLIKHSPSLPTIKSILLSAKEIVSSSEFYIHSLYTIKIVTIGVLISLIVGFIIAVICSMNSIANNLIMPIMNSTKNIPSIALFPLFIVLMGIGNGLIFQQINRPNIEDLQNDKELLFSGTKNADNTYMKYKWNAQKKYLVKQKFDLFVTGRRIAESNNCGKKSGNFVRRGNVYDSFSPIAIWTTEDVFAYLKYNNIELPWQYVNTINGFAYGSVAWTERRRFGHLYATMKERLEEVYNANKNVLIDLRNNIPEIDAFLKEKGI